MKLFTTFKSYPLTLIYAFFLAYGLSYHTSYTLPPEKVNMLLVSFLAFPFFAALAYRWVIYKTPLHEKILLSVLWFMTAFCYYVFLPFNVFEVSHFYFEYICLALLGAGFALSYPLGHKREQLTWGYISSVLIQSLKTILFSAITYLCVLALFWSLNTLFSLDIHHTWYGNAWYFCACFLSILFFFTFLPKTPQDILKEEKGTEIFLLESLGKFVLFPVACIYAVILYAYDVMILVQGTLPSGLLGYSVAFFGVTLTVTFFFVHHMRQQIWWVQKGALISALLLIPQTVLLFYALFLRVGQYGITESRYLLGVLGIFFVLLILREILWREKKLWMVPVLVMVLLVPTLFGPWSMYHVSQQSQLNRLEMLLTEHKVWVDGKLVVPEKQLSNEAQREIQEVFRYLRYTHGDDVIRTKLPGGDLLLDDADIQKALGVEYLSPKAFTSYCSGGMGYDQVVNVGGYQRYVKDVSMYKNTPNETIYTFAGKDATQVEISVPNPGTFVIHLKTGDRVLAMLDLKTLSTQFEKEGCLGTKMGFEIPKDSVVDAQSNDYMLRFIPRSVSMVNHGTTWEMESISGDLLVGWK